MWGTEELQMDGEKLTREMTLSDGSKMTLEWTLYQQESGTTVTITTDAITLTVYVVRPGLKFYYT
jgi:hypothetical protein